MQHLREAATALLPDLISLRRALHAYPELGLDLPRTQALILDALAPLDLEIIAGENLSSVTAVLRGAGDGPSVLLRADMDALPIHEKTGLPYSSNNGAMHACGHDMHVAGLIGAARLLHARRDRLAGSVVFMFQPGEESGGGAQRMIAEGVLDAAGKRVEAAYALHVGPGPRGAFLTKPGPILAGVSALKVRVRGRGGHAARPHLAVDPVPAVAEIVLGLQSWVSRRFDVFDPVVLSVTRLFAGEALNVIPDEAGLAASVRTLSAQSIATVQRELPALIEHIAAAHGCSAETEVIVGYPATVNDAEAASDAIDALTALFGPGRVEALDAPAMASEDFSFVLQEVRGAYIFFRTTPAHLDPRDAPGNHSPLAVFDDSLLGDQAAALAALALRHVSAP